MKHNDGVRNIGCTSRPTHLICSSHYIITHNMHASVCVCASVLQSNLLRWRIQYRRYNNPYGLALRTFLIVSNSCRNIYMQLILLLYNQLLQCFCYHPDIRILCIHSIIIQLSNYMWFTAIIHISLFHKLLLFPINNVYADGIHVQ